MSNNQNSYTTLVAPDSGIITALNVEAGQVVAAGQAIGTLAAGHEPEAVIALPEQEMSKIHPGSTATISFWALPDVKVQGIVREISPVPDPVARTYTVKNYLTKSSKRCATRYDHQCHSKSNGYSGYFHTVDGVGERQTR